MFTFNDDGLTLETKAGKISLWAREEALGLTVENDKGMINIVSEDGFPPCIDFFGKTPGIKTPYALYANEGRISYSSWK